MKRLLLLSLLVSPLASYGAMQSAAYNYGSHSGHVNTRTGQLSFSVPLAHIASHGYGGKGFHLGMSYSQSSNYASETLSPYAISGHWSFGLPMMVKEEVSSTTEYVLYLGNGTQHYISGWEGSGDSRTAIFNYDSMRSYVVTGSFSGNSLVSITVLSPQGVLETFRSYGNTWVIEDIRHPKGYQVNFHYGFEAPHALQYVTDSLGNQIAVFHDDNQLKIQSVLVNDQQSKKINHSVNLSLGSLPGGNASEMQLNFLTRKASANASDTQTYTTTYTYYNQTSSNADGLLRSVVGPLGSYTGISYGKLPVGGSTELEPVVAQMCHKHDKSSAAYRSTQYIYGSVNGSEVSDSTNCYGTPSLTSNGPSYQGHNYTGNGVTTSEKLFGPNYENYHYEVKTISSNSLRYDLGGQNESRTEHINRYFYDSLQRMTNHEGEVLQVQGYSNNQTSKVLHQSEVMMNYAPVSDCASSSEYNCYMQWLARDYSGLQKGAPKWKLSFSPTAFYANTSQPKSLSYDLPKIVRSKVMDKAGKTYIKTTTKSYDPTSGKLISESHYTDGAETALGELIGSKSITYDQVHKYTVPIFPETVTTTLPSGAEFITTHIIQGYVADVFSTPGTAVTANGGNEFEGLKGPYPQVSAGTTFYYAPVSVTQSFNPNGQEVKGVQLPAGKDWSQSYPMEETLHKWGGVPVTTTQAAALKVLSTQKSARYPHIYSVTQQYPEGSAFLNDPAILTNSDQGNQGKADKGSPILKGLAPGTPLVMDYNYAYNSENRTYTLTTSKEAKLSPDAKSADVLSNSKTYDMSSGLPLSSSGLIETSSGPVPGVGNITYNSLGQVIAKTHSVNGEEVGSKQYARWIGPDETNKGAYDQYQLSVNDETDYWSLVAKNNRGKVIATYDNAFTGYGSGSSVGYETACPTYNSSNIGLTLPAGISELSGHLCQIGSSEYNVLGQKLQSTSYNSADSAFDKSTSETTTYAYDLLGRPLSSQGTNEVEVHHVYDPIWTDSTLSPSKQDLEGDQVSLGASYVSYAGKASIEDIPHPAFTIHEIGLKRHKHLAGYLVPYPVASTDTDSSGVNDRTASLATKVYADCSTDGTLKIDATCLENIIKNKNYYSKSSKTYNAHGQLISSTGVAADAKDYFNPGSESSNSAASANTVTMDYYYNLFGEPVATVGPLKVNTSASGEGYDYSSAATIYKRYNIFGEMVCKSMATAVSADNLGFNRCFAGSNTPANPENSQLLVAREYNEVGDVLVLYSGEGQQRTYAYNVDGSLNQSTDAVSNTRTYQYGPLGLLAKTTSTDASGEWHTKTYHYDLPGHRLSSLMKTDSQGQDQTSYTYYRGGKVQTAIEAMGTLNNVGDDYAITKTYDPQTGQLMSMKDSFNNQENYYYGINGLAEMTYTQPGSASPLITINHQHDPYGHIEQVTRTGGQPITYKHDGYGGLTDIQIGNAESNLSYVYDYLAGGNIASVNVSNTLPKFSAFNGEYDYTYNLKDELTNYAVVADVSDVSSPNINAYPLDRPNQWIKSRAYTYDLNHNISSVQTTILDDQLNPQSDVVEYGYHDKSRTHLKTLSFKEGDQGDANGVAISDKIERLKSRYSEDEKYNDNGQLTDSAEGGAYQYNARNQLISYELNTDEKNSHVPVILETYAYNTNGLLREQSSAFKKAGSANATELSSTSVKYYYDGSQLLQQVQGDTRAYYIPGIANIVTTKGQAPEVTYLYGVRQGSVAATGPMGVKDAAGSIDHVYQYTPYGMQTTMMPRTASSAKPKPNTQTAPGEASAIDISRNNFGYTGQQLSTSTGCMIMGEFRCYDPALHRFRQHDSMSAFSGHHTFNHFAYGSANPIKYDDPSGHFSWSGLGKTIVGELAAGAAAYGALMTTWNPVAVDAAYSAVQTKVSMDFNHQHGFNVKHFGANAAANAITAGVGVAAAVVTPETGGTSDIAYGAVSGAVSGAMQGLFSSAASQGINTGHVNWKSAGINAGINAGLSAVTSGLGPVASKLGAGMGGAAMADDAADAAVSGIEVNDMAMADDDVKVDAQVGKALSEEILPGLKLPDGYEAVPDELDANHIDIRPTKEHEQTLKAGGKRIGIKASMKDDGTLELRGGYTEYTSENIWRGKNGSYVKGATINDLNKVMGGKRYLNSMTGESRKFSSVEGQKL